MRHHLRHSSLHCGGAGDGGGRLGYLEQAAVHSRDVQYGVAWELSLRAWIISSARTTVYIFVAHVLEYTSIVVVGGHWIAVGR